MPPALREPSPAAFVTTCVAEYEALYYEQAAEGLAGALRSRTTLRPSTELWRNNFPAGLERATAVHDGVSVSSDRRK